MRQAGKGGRKNKFLVTAMEFVCVLLRLWSVILALVLFILTPHLTMADITIVLKSAPSSHVKLNIRLG